jgi:hypothetical protein
MRISGPTRGEFNVPLRACGASSFSGLIRSCATLSICSRTSLKCPTNLQYLVELNSTFTKFCLSVRAFGRTYLEISFFCVCSWAILWRNSRRFSNNFKKVCSSTNTYYLNNHILPLLLSEIRPAWIKVGQRNFMPTIYYGPGNQFSPKLATSG